MQLWEYEGKKVRIVDIDGDVFTGFADIYHHAEDNASGIASLSLVLESGKENLSFELVDDILIDFEEHEIAGIEILDDAIPTMPIRPAAAQRVV